MSKKIIVPIDDSIHSHHALQFAVKIAKEMDGEIVDIETLKKTQENLVSTLEETLRIQAEGRAKRHQAEQELVTMEEQLKQKLLEIREN